MSTLSFLFFILFLLGLYFYAKGDDLSYNINEGFTTKKANGFRCPNLLIQKGSRFYLYNSKVTQVPGVNPIEFDNLEDYTEFLQWQRSQNIRCPVLYLQETFDAQGNKVYKSRPSVSEPQAGLPSSILGVFEEKKNFLTNPTLLVDAGRNNFPLNYDSFPAHDPSDYYIGTTTPLDMMDIQAELQPVSADPMHSNWGGAKFAEKFVEENI